MRLVYGLVVVSVLAAVMVMSVSVFRAVMMARGLGWFFPLKRSARWMRRMDFWVSFCVVAVLERQMARLMLKSLMLYGSSALLRSSRKVLYDFIAAWNCFRDC